ncbi:hypothetical protein ACRB8A_20180 (plasmid) [Arthrobacter sp. G.S.26]|uniref:hypothetical protein n=1 Tax=Arthrobacter sp. G.S.26 TaxID=3433706 RepID=UPI003D772D93
MSVKRTLVIGTTVVVLAVGANAMLEPRTAAERREQHQQQQTGDLSDSVDNSNERKRDEANDAVDAENTRKLDPAEPRHPEKLKLRLRWP